MSFIYRSSAKNWAHFLRPSYGNYVKKLDCATWTALPAKCCLYHSLLNVLQDIYRLCHAICVSPFSISLQNYGRFLRLPPLVQHQIEESNLFICPAWSLLMAVMQTVNGRVFPLKTLFISPCARSNWAVQTYIHERTLSLQSSGDLWQHIHKCRSLVVG